MGKIEKLRWMAMRHRVISRAEGGCYMLVLCVIVCAVVALMLCGCKSIEYVPVEKVVKEYVTKHDTVMQKDSVWLHDSVFIHAKGDTVWYEKWHTKYVDRWKERIVTDTVIKVDSIPVPYPVEKKAEVLPWYRKLWLEAKYILIGMVIGVLLVLTKSLWMKLLKLVV